MLNARCGMPDAERQITSGRGICAIQKICGSFIRPHRTPSISSASLVVKKSSSVNSDSGIWNTLIHKEAAEVSGGPTIITDPQFGNSDDLLINHCSLITERRVVSLCRRGENRLLFIDHSSLVIERSANRAQRQRVQIRPVTSMI